MLTYISFIRTFFSSLSEAFYSITTYHVRLGFTDWLAKRPDQYTKREWNCKTADKDCASREVNLSWKRYVSLIKYPEDFEWNGRWKQRVAFKMYERDDVTTCFRKFGKQRQRRQMQCDCSHAVPPHGSSGSLSGFFARHLCTLVLVCASGLGKSSESYWSWSNLQSATWLGHSRQTHRCKGKMRRNCHSFKKILIIFRI